MIGRWCLLAAVAAGCGSEPPVAKPPPDLELVAPEFRGSTTPMADVIGVAYQLPTGADATSQAIRAFAASALRDAGIHHARADLLWDVAEPVPGAVDFSAYTTEVDTYAGAGVLALPILCYGNPWANAMPSGTSVPPDDPADFARFAAAAATAFAGRLSAYEVWNEENLGFRFWQPREDGSAYGTLLEATSRAIRGADAAARVVLGGVVYHGLFTDAETYLETLYTKHPDIAAAYDVLAFHPYPIYPPSVAPEVDDPVRGEVATARMVARLRALLVYYGDDSARALWATEVGWPVYESVDEERQARWLVRAVLLLAGAGVERAYWYTLFDGPDPAAFPPEDAFGLFHYDDPSVDGFAPTPKLAWTALSTLLAIAGPLAVTTDVSAELVGAPPGAHAYRLQDPSGVQARRVTIVWSSDDDAPATTISVPVSGSARVVDMLGADLGASSSVPLSGRPVYVIEGP